MLPRKVVCHVHFPEVFIDLIPYIQSIKPEQVIITHTTTEPIKVPKLFSDFTQVIQTKVDNRGRDTLPLLLLARHGVFDSPAVFWKLHTKKSLHLLNGKKWLEELVQPLARDSKQANYVYDLIANFGIDMVGAKKYTHLSGSNDFTTHRAIYDQWTRDLGIEFKTGKPFVLGTIFAAHSDVLKKLAQLTWHIEEFVMEETPSFNLNFKLRLFLGSHLKHFSASKRYRNWILETTPNPGTTYALEAFVSNLASNYRAIE